MRAGVSGDGPARGGRRARLLALFRREVAQPGEVSRRLVHGAGAFVLVYYVVPSSLLFLPKSFLLLLALAVAFALELLRLGGALALPMIRDYETRRPASFLFYAVALAAALLVLPEAIAVAVVLGTAFVDPVAGALRATPRGRRLALGLPFALYAALAFVALAGVGRWPWAEALGLAGLAAALGVGVERWRFRWLDDDLTMTVVPAAALYLVGVVALGRPG